VIIDLTPALRFYVWRATSEYAAQLNRAMSALLAAIGLRQMRHGPDCRSAGGHRREPARRAAHRTGIIERQAASDERRDKPASARRVPCRARPGPAASGGGDWISRITAAERAAELASSDLARAVDALGEAQMQAPAMAGQRHLDPDARHRYVLLFEAEEKWQRCIAADDAAQARKDRLVDQFNELTRPVPRWAALDDGGLQERPRR
jgi:hypothetical protein